MYPAFLVLINEIHNAQGGAVTSKPNKWIAAMLSFLSQPIGMMYVGQIRWAGIYVLLALMLVIGAFCFHQFDVEFLSCKFFLLLLRRFMPIVWH